MNRQDADILKHHDALNASSAETSKSRTVQLPKGRLPVVAQTVQVTATAPQGLRTFMLGAANGRHGVAEYRLLLAHGRVERAEATGDKTIDGADALLKQVDLGKLFPEDSSAKLVRAAMVNCFGDKCQLVLEP